MFSIQLSVEIYSVLGPTERERKAFSGGARRAWDPIMRLSSRTFHDHKRLKSLSVWEV